jgi:hypothetical protein
MNTKRHFLVSSVIALSFFSGGAFANGVAAHFSEAVDHSGQAAAHASVAGVKVVSGVVAAPLVAGGAVGQVVGEGGKILWDIANSPIGDSLPVGDETLTAGPSPAEMMSREEQQ